MSWNGKVAVLGAGKLGSALISGLLEAQAVDPDNLTASDVSEEQAAAVAERFGIRCTAGDNQEAASASDVIVLAVKPYQVSRVLDEIRLVLGLDRILVSLAAGVPLDVLASHAPVAMPVFRAMPNLALTVGESATGISANAAANEEHKAIVERLFLTVGSVEFVPEAWIDAVTGLSGSGPAYVFLVIEALAAAGVRQGLPAAVAQELATQTVLGAATLCRERGVHPALLRDEVTTPAGTTIAGLQELESGRLRAVISDAVAAATLRATEISEAMKATQKK